MVGLNAIDSSSCKLQSLVMVGFGPKLEANLLADGLWVHFVGTLQLLLTAKIALVKTFHICFVYKPNVLMRLRTLLIKIR